MFFFFFFFPLAVFPHSILTGIVHSGLLFGATRSVTQLNQQRLMIAIQTLPFCPHEPTGSAMKHKQKEQQRKTKTIPHVHSFYESKENGAKLQIN